MCFWTTLVNTAQVCDGLGADEFWALGGVQDFEGTPPELYPYPEYLQGGFPGTAWSIEGTSGYKLLRRVFALRRPDHTLISYTPNYSTDTSGILTITGPGIPSFVPTIVPGEWHFGSGNDGEQLPGQANNYSMFTIKPLPTGLTTVVTHHADAYYGGGSSFEYVWED